MSSGLHNIGSILLDGSRDSYIQMEFPIRRGEALVFEEQELDFPETRRVDPKRVRLGPVLAIGQGDVQRGPSRAVDFNGLVESKCGVVDESHSDQVDADRVAQARGLMVGDA